MLGKPGVYGAGLLLYAVLVLWLERDIYRYFVDAREMGDIAPRPWRKMGDPENTRIFFLSLLGKELWWIFKGFLCDDIPCPEDYKYRLPRKRNNLFGVLFALRIAQLLDVESYCSCYYCYYW
ncbi:hypothetical protein AVEN_146006-1 [Araneus ventricosus]|uniref:Uncharacterized protein n=1 Tax=Araneus ventricosus TaxID=182803 RepID=A0A4Y2UAP2_ARAVE|nr:hypothetical protein AVEN_146006-1 [Araneus ventricosus]